MTVNYTIIKQEDFDPENLPDEGCLREVILDWDRYGREEDDSWIAKGECNYLLWRNTEVSDKFVLCVNVWYHPPHDDDDDDYPYVVQYLEVEVVTLKDKEDKA